MKRVSQLFAVFGGLNFLVLLFVLPQLYTAYRTLSEFDAGAADVYRRFGEKLIETGDPAEASVWKFRVEDGLEISDVEEIMMLVAPEYNLKHTGQSVLFRSEDSKEVVKLTGRPFRFSKTYFFCNSITAAHMFHHNPAYSAYTPCRISLIEDGDGVLWLYTLNIDMMIYGGKPLPPELKAEAIQVKKGLLAIMERAATGAF